MNNVIGFPMILISWIVVYTLDSVIHCSNNAVPEPGGGGKRQGLGLRNDVLITCKAVTLHCGQRIIAVFSQSRYFRSEKWASRGNNSIVEKKNIMAVWFSRISYLSFGTEIAKCKWRSRIIISVKNNYYS